MQPFQVCLRLTEQRTRQSSRNADRKVKSDMSIKGFANQGSQDIFYKLNTKKARRQVEQQFWGMAQTLLLILNQATKMMDLQQAPGLRLEPLKHDKPGYHSIRVNNRFRIIFIWKDGNAYDVSVEDPKHHEP